MKKGIAYLLALAVLMAMLAGCGNAESSQEGEFKAGENGVVKVYNWGDYIDEEVIGLFEKETGIEVVYDLFENNEEMYPIIEAGGRVYDAVCPSDYMIERMLQNGLLQKINMDNVPNIEYIGQTHMQGAQSFDPENAYAAPYTFGTVGIMYNTTMVGEDEVRSWNVLWDEKYSQSIVMYESVRDSLAPALKLLGYSLNTTDRGQLEEATELLVQQKPLVYSYVMDQIKDLMINGEVALGLAYSGEVLAIQEQNPDIAFCVPDEGSNYYMDAWVIPANAENKENAEAWINFLCRPDIAKRNFEYITYSTPNEGAIALLDESYLENTDVFPEDAVIERCEVFQYLGEEMDQYYADLWKRVKAAR